MNLYLLVMAGQGDTHVKLVTKPIRAAGDGGMPTSNANALPNKATVSKRGLSLTSLCARIRRVAKKKAAPKSRKKNLTPPDLQAELPPESNNGNGRLLSTLDDLTPDGRNANLGTERGQAMLRESVETCGLGRSIVVDKHGVVISGNKTLDAAKAHSAGMELVQTTGSELVVVQRTDLDLLEDAKARQLAYYDNRVQELDLQWSGAQLQSDLLAGVEVGEAFFPEEFDRLVKATPLTSEPVLVDPAPDPLAPPATSTPAEAPSLLATAGTARTERPPDVTLTFNTIEQQLRWGAFMRRLREIYPGLDTPAARLAAHLTTLGLA